MQKMILAVAGLLLAGTALFAQSKSEVILKTSSGAISGTLMFPQPKRIAGKYPSVVLFIAGSGPTDRDGNNAQMKGNALLQLSDSLAAYGIASLRYDKRGIGKSKAAAADESTLRFDDYASDAAAWIRQLQRDKRFRKIFVLGHSEGSLIGMLAVQRQPVAGFISVAGPGTPADAAILRQLRNAPNFPPGALDTMAQLLTTLKRDGRLATIPDNPFYKGFFRASVQPYFASWMKYDPAVEIAKVPARTLIVQGTSDIQVDTAQATMLAAGNPRAALRIVRDMNHIFKMAPADDIQANTATYYEPETPIMSALVAEVVDFVTRTAKKR